MADIGTDHGWLPIWLVRQGLVPNAFACDSREAPLARARRNIERAGVNDRVSPRQGEGLEPVQHETLGTVTIAGVGSKTICEILQKVPALRPPRLVLAPNDDGIATRRCLHQRGYVLVREDVVTDAGRSYLVLLAFDGARSGEQHHLEALEPGAPTPGVPLTRAQELLGPTPTTVELRHVEHLRQRIVRVEGIALAAPEGSEKFERVTGDLAILRDRLALLEEHLKQARRH